MNTYMAISEGAINIVYHLAVQCSINTLSSLSSITMGQLVYAVSSVSESIGISALEVKSILAYAYLPSAFPGGIGTGCDTQLLSNLIRRGNHVIGHYNPGTGISMPWLTHELATMNQDWAVDLINKLADFRI